MPASTSFPTAFLTKDKRGLSWQAYLVLILMCLAFFLPGLSTIPPVDRDESRFAQATKQMIETNNYTDIRFQEEARYKKPIGIYWLQAANVRFFNADHLNEIWAYRLPSLIGATIAVVMTAALGALFFGPMAGFLAAILMASCLILNVEARLAKTDAALLGSIMVAQYALARAYVFRGKKNFGWKIPLVFWTAQAAAFLIKGPILLLVTVSTLLVLKISDKKLDWFKALKPVAGFIYALLLVAPWFVSIMLASHGSFATQSAGHDMFAKLWQGQDRGIMPPGLHLLAFAIVFFPGSLVALLAIPDIWKNRREPMILFCLGWIIPTWIVFELSLTKLPHYVMPTYPAIAILAAKVMLDGFPVLAARRWRWLPPLSVGLWFVIGTGLAIGLVMLPYITDHVWNVSQIIAGLLLVAMLTVTPLLLPQRNPNSILMIGGGSLLFTLITFGYTLPSLKHVWLTQQVMKVAATAKPCAEIKIATATYNEPSLVFMAGTDTYMPTDSTFVAERMKRDHCWIGVIDDEHQKSFVNSFNGNHKPVAIAELAGLNIGSGRPAKLTMYRMGKNP